MTDTPDTKPAPPDVDAGLLPAPDEVVPLAAVVPDRPDPDEIIASSWGDWVHDRIAGITTPATVTLSLSATISTTPYGLQSLVVPADTADRLLLIEASALLTITGLIDFWIYLNNNASKRVRFGTSGQSCKISQHWLLPAGTAMTVQPRISTISATMAASTSGAGDLNYLSVAVI